MEDADIERRISIVHRTTKQEQKSKAILKKVLRRLIITFTIRTCVFAGELAAGIIADSLALQADAFEKLSDMCYLSVTTFSVWLSARAANDKYTFGYYRAGVIGALISAFIMWIIAAVLVYKAVVRIQNLENEQVEGMVIFITAIIGLAVNIVVMLVLRSDDEEEEKPKIELKKESKDNVKNEVGEHEMKLVKEKEAVKSVAKKDNEGEAEKKKPETDDDSIEENSKGNVNLRAVILDILGDMVMSVLTIITSILVWTQPQKLKIADPICSLFFPVVVFFVTKPIITECVQVLMERTPADFDLNKLKRKLVKVSGVTQLDDIHLWSLASGKNAIALHLKVKPGSKKILQDTKHVCHTFGIEYSTIQIEEETEELKNNTDI